MGNIKHLTLLHSNDMHGDFLAETLDDQLVGGVSMLSGYVNSVRKECPNTLYMVAGDMFRGSIIDTDFQGVSTIDIMNTLAPDVVSLGNHEMDYGIAHLLFLEKCCKFPIVNSNIYIKTNGTRLFSSHKILEVDGMKILVMGILTDTIMAKAKKDLLLGTFVELHDAAEEVENICNSYKDTDIDLTILLTHIGYAEDQELANKLDPALGVDLIIGGHSHTLLEEPTRVNDILIVQAGVGTNQIGRFELDIDTDTNSVANYTWETIPIDAEHCVKNEEIEKLILDYKAITDGKYGKILTTLLEPATHPARYQETMAGNLFCDALLSQYHLDLVMLGSGSLRTNRIGSVITVGDLLDMYPYEEKLVKVQLTGAQIKHAVTYFMDQSVGIPGSDSEYYQFSKGFKAVYSLSDKTLLELTYQGEPIQPNQLFWVGLEGYHATNIKKFLDLDRQANEEPILLTQNIRVAVQEYLKTHAHLFPQLEGRTVVE